MVFERTRNVLKKYRKLIIQCILYLILLVVFVNFYLIDEIVNYAKGSTTLSSRTENVEYLEAPYMTLCLQPPFKPSMLLKHGLPQNTKNIKDLYKTLKRVQKEERIMTIYENLSYKYEKDFNVRLERLEVLKNGSKLAEQIDFEIQIIVTQSGLCHLIKYNMNVSINDDMIRLHYSSKAFDYDTPEYAKILLSSPHGWHGIVLDDWPFFDPTILKIPIEKLQAQRWTTKVSQTDYQYMTGTINFEQCLLEQIARNSVCKTNCYPLVFNFLPNFTLCHSEELSCMFNLLVNKRKYRYECLRAKKNIQYKASIYPSFKLNSNGSDFTFVLHFDKGTKDIKEEVLIITTGSFIGSVGGSLGLFLGFSFFTYLSGIIDKVLP